MLYFGLYVRRSSESDKSDSIQNQIDHCTELLEGLYKSTEYTTIHYIEREGVSGGTADRIEYQRMLSDMKSGLLTGIVAYKLDRISRNVRDTAEFIELTLRYKVKLHCVRDMIDQETTGGIGMMQISSVFAEMQRRDTSVRVKDNALKMVLKGLWPGGSAPLGSRRVKIRVNGKMHTTLAKDEETYPVLEKIQRDFLLGGHSADKLERIYRQEGYRSPTGAALISSRIHTILTNPCGVAATGEVWDYYSEKGCKMAYPRERFDGTQGVLIYGRTTGSRTTQHVKTTPDKWTVSLGLYEPWIDPGLWLKIQKRFRDNTCMKERKHWIGLLHGFVRCKYCNSLMHAKRKNDRHYNKTYESYYCAGRMRYGAEYCSSPSVRVADLDDKIIEILREMKIDKQLLLKHLKALEPAANVRSASAVRRDITNTEKKIANLTQSLRDNTSSAAAKYIIAEIEALDAKINQFNAELHEIELEKREAASLEEKANQIYTFIVELLENFDTLEYKQKSELIRKIFKKCTWDNSSLEVFF